MHEYGGVVFAYMGPPEKKPPFPVYDTFARPGWRMIAGRKYFYPCNWLQMHENHMDPAHTAFLHTIVSGVVFTAPDDDAAALVPLLDALGCPDS